MANTSSPGLALEAVERVPWSFPSYDCDQFVHDARTGNFIIAARNHRVAPSDSGNRYVMLLAAGTRPVTIAPAENDDAIGRGSEAVSRVVPAVLHEAGLRYSALTMMLEPGARRTNNEYHVLCVHVDDSGFDPEDTYNGARFVVSRTRVTADRQLEPAGEVKLPQPPDTSGDDVQMKLFERDGAAHVAVLNVHKAVGNKVFGKRSLTIYRVETVGSGEDSQPQLIPVMNCVPVRDLCTGAYSAWSLFTTASQDDVLFLVPAEQQLIIKRVTLPASPTISEIAAVRVATVATTPESNPYHSGAWCGRNSSYYAHVLCDKQRRLIEIRRIERGALSSDPSQPSSPVATFDVGAYATKQTRDNCENMTPWWSEEVGVLFVSWGTQVYGLGDAYILALFVTHVSWRRAVTHGLVPRVVRDCLRTVAGLRTIGAADTWASLPPEVFEIFVACYWDEYLRGRVLPS